jgi:hypothetical protein
VIVVSVLLVLAAGVLLGLGLVYLDEPLLYSSIGVSGLAALALVIGVRRLAAVRAGQGLITVRPAGATLRLGSTTVRPEQPAPATGRVTPRPVGRATPRPVGRARVEPPASDVESMSVDQLDEPVESVTDDDTARLRLLHNEVIVVDGRPRYHRADCASLDGEESETLPVSEAVELGFTGCGRCLPARTLLQVADGQ